MISSPLHFCGNHYPWLANHRGKPQRQTNTSFTNALHFFDNATSTSGYRFRMKTQRPIIVFTVINLIILAATFIHADSTPAPQVTPILRTRGLELVDEQGRVRAELKVFPAQPDVKMPDGTKGYPESVLLRLINSRGGPDIKITTTEDGAGIVVGGQSGYLQFLSRGTNLPFIKLVAKDGKEQTIKL
jgi:hypothetical protein